MHHQVLQDIGGQGVCTALKLGEPVQRAVGELQEAEHDDPLEDHQSKVAEPVRRPAQPARIAEKQKIQITEHLPTSPFPKTWALQHRQVKERWRRTRTSRA